MKKATCYMYYTVCCTLCFVFAVSVAAAETLCPVEKAEGFVSLFDGKALSPDIWQSAIEGYPVRDGAVVCEKGGNLMTKKEYGDFVLRFEFALPPGGNNGVGIRAESPTKDAAYHGMEIQVLDNSAEKYKNLKPYQFHGSIYGVATVKRDPEKNDFQKPLGEWNCQEITASGSRIMVVLNGEKILDADISEFKEKPTLDGKAHPGLHREKGLVGFLGHGDPVKFRNIRIKELNTLSEDEKKDGFELLFDGKAASPEIWKGDFTGYPVENGAFVYRKALSDIKKTRGNLTTIKEYEDFELRFEFLLPPAGNSGIMFRGATEIQVLDNFADKYKDLKAYQYHGSLYYSIPARRNIEKNDYQRPVGQWNFQQVIAKGPKVQVILNGETILDADVTELKGKKSMDDKEHPELQRPKGALGFLGHSDPVEFRGIRVKELK